MAAPAEDPAVEQAAVERAPGERVKMTVSMRDADSLATALRGWLAERVGASEPPQLTGARMPASGGLSSTSLLFEAAWSSEGTPCRGAYVARMAPEMSAVPVFPRYDLPGQYRLIEQVSKRCEVPLDRLRWHVDQQYDYYRWALADDGVEIPIIERSLDWLERHWPAETGPDVLSWGDARIGNVIYDGFTPVAVLDWEMAALGPRELDVAWFIFLHRFFQDIAEFFELPGLPDFLRRSQVEGHYTEFSGYQLRDMDFYLTYAAARHAIVMARVKRRMIHFGEDQVPDDIDDSVMHRASLDKLLAGTDRWD